MYCPSQINAALGFEQAISQPPVQLASPFALQSTWQLRFAFVLQVAEHEPLHFASQVALASTLQFAEHSLLQEASQVPLHFAWH
jgi:hypothetical protein